MEKFSIRLDKAMKIRKIKAIQLARATKISRSTITNYLRDEYQPKSDKTFKIAQALNINPSWLLGYDVSMELPRDTRLATQDDIDNFAYNDKFTNYNFYYRSYISNLSAGSFQELLVDTNSDKVPVPIRFKPFDKRINLFKINGTSMNKVIQNGSIVVTLDNNNNSEVYSNGTIVVVFYNNEATVKRFYDEGEYILLKPDSTDTSHKTIVIQKGVSEFYLVGKVVWHLNPSDMERYYN